MCMVRLAFKLIGVIFLVSSLLVDPIRVTDKFS